MVASIEAPLTFLQEPEEILLFEAVETPHVALRLISEVLDAVDVVVLVGEELGMVDPDVMKS